MPKTPQDGVPTIEQRLAALAALVQAGLPSVVAGPARFLIDGHASRSVCAVADRIEQVRAEIAAGGEQTVPILYSPRPGSAGNDTSAAARPQHGQVLEFTLERVANTGKGRRWGTFLHLLSTAANAQNILELGACAGLSGCYLSATEHCQQFVTVEGAPALAEIAARSLKQAGRHATVINALFDDALDRLLPPKQPLDLAFIDGHHEKIATLHYFERLTPHVRPGGIVLFDDISWSSDMRDCWNEVVTDRRLTDVVDCGVVGIGIMADGSRNAAPAAWNLQDIVGRVRIGSPKGWTESAAA
jgi:predicted O-methyltransferase YrrM